MKRQDAVLLTITLHIDVKGQRIFGLRKENTLLELKLIVRIKDITTMLRVIWLPKFVGILPVCKCWPLSLSKMRKCGLLCTWHAFYKYLFLYIFMYISNFSLSCTL